MKWLLVNPDIASRLDLMVDVTGFSADLLIFVSMLSAALRIPIPANIIMTGHIASVEGDIGTVSSIQAKVKAALEDKSIDRLIYPQANAIEEIFDRDILSVSAVSSLEELMKLVFSEEDIVAASLENGFFENSVKVTGLKDTIGRLVQYLVFDNNSRFWQILRRYLLTGNSEKARQLLELFAGYHIRKIAYPAHFGDRLFSLICATPPAVKKAQDLFPLLDTGQCIQLAGLAKVSDYEDVYKMFDAVRGKITQNTFQLGVSLPSRPNLSGQDNNNIFDEVNSQINELALSREFGIAIDSARASFILNSVIVDSYKEFLETITFFYIHLRCYENPEPVESIDQHRSKDEAVELLERTFQNNGGLEAAFQRASNGTEGGMRRILDEMTDFYKQDQLQKHVSAVFKRSIDSLSWDQKVEFMCCVMEKLKNILPEELRNEPPERFARDYEMIVKAYVKSMDKFNQLIRRY